ncbi:TIGR04150 pseudo-rSAM protein [Parabacteroides distasonis]|uniref:TIGR04150 pseudo-rSAM protein n=1 Tax=Parabacteroides distasonis TaxID=823 RepID=UPI003F742585
MKTLNIETLWLYLEPYTFITEDTDYYFFYNANAFKSISFRKNKVINPIVAELQNIDNLYSVKIHVKDLEDVRLLNFVKSLQASGDGDIIEGDLEKPLIMPPILNLQKSVERLKEHKVSIGENILSYLHEISIYVNGTCLLDCPNCQDRHKQYLCCTKSANTLDPTFLKNFLFSISQTKIAITLVGGNIFQYGLEEILAILVGIDVTHTLVSDWRNIPEDLGLLNETKKENFQLKILVNELTDTSPVIALAQRIKDLQIKQYWVISITSFLEYEKAEALSESLSELVDDVTIRPFYTGENIAFFEECIFIDQEELDNIELDRQGVFALQALNTNNFGKITILSDGNVYANVNEKSLGHIQDPIKKMLCEELEKGTSWRRTRYDLAPCSQCRYKLICPSPSNYELAIEKNNLCHINPL